MDYSGLPLDVGAKVGVVYLNLGNDPIRLIDRIDTRQVWRQPPPPQEQLFFGVYYPKGKK